MAGLVKPFNVECVDGLKVAKRNPVRILGGWELKAFALVHSPFREVLLLDADNTPVKNPLYLFSTPAFEENGAIFWPDYLRGRDKKNAAIWRSFGVRRPSEPEFESGQIMVDKARCWKALCLTVGINENSDFYYRYLHGDKETFHLAFAKTKTKYSMIPHPIHPLEGNMCQHDFEGNRIFQHRNSAKWNLQFNRRIKGFWYEDECLYFIEQLRKQWNGRLVSRRKQAIFNLERGSSTSSGQR
jgi:hypothetical protein